MTRYVDSGRSDADETRGDLTGRRVALTAGRRADEQVSFFTRRGAEVLEAPTVASVAADDPRLLDAIDDLVAVPPDVLVLHTGTGVRLLFERVAEAGRERPLLDALAKTAVVARGPKPARAAAQHGLAVAWQSPRGRFADLVGWVQVNRPGARVALQLDGDLGESSPEADLALAGSMARVAAEVVALPVYRWELPADREPVHALIRAIEEGSVDVVTFTSSPAVAGLTAIAAEIGRDRRLREGFSGGVGAACIGEVCAAAARTAGIEPAVVPARPRLGALLLATAEWLTARPPPASR